MTAGMVRDAVYGVGFPTIFIASLIDGRGFGRYAYNKALEDRVAATSGHVIYKLMGKQRSIGIDADEPDFVASPLESAYFEKTMDLFAAAHIPVLLLTTPASQSTIRAVSDATKTQFASFLRTAAERHPNIVLGAPALLGWPDSFYIDGSHMNQTGAKAFTGRLAACLGPWMRQPHLLQPCELSWK
jgi:hypothetical protein